MSYSVSICDLGKPNIPEKSTVISLIQLHTDIEGNTGAMEIKITACVKPLCRIAIE